MQISTGTDFGDEVDWECGIWNLPAGGQVGN